MQCDMYPYLSISIWSTAIQIGIKVHSRHNAKLETHLAVNQEGNFTWNMDLSTIINNNVNNPNISKNKSNTRHVWNNIDNYEWNIETNLIEVTNNLECKLN